ncbi:hypothetical protein CFter6_0730 [Collimonas fungivorans]|uniref:Uncharacterized protein n=1 Tax=Collimonas fungivorans TaxID=158899 RepID=A0A127P714_9BURK|nr:hypothetical protein CFter6_0730 [Collimonas fungivorans]
MCLYYNSLTIAWKHEQNMHSRKKSTPVLPLTCSFFNNSKKTK